MQEHMLQVPVPAALTAAATPHCPAPVRLMDLAWKSGQHVHFEHVEDVSPLCAVAPS